MRITRGWSYLWWLSINPALCGASSPPPHQLRTASIEPLPIRKKQLHRRFVSSLRFHQGRDQSHEKRRRQPRRFSPFLTNRALPRDCRPPPGAIASLCCSGYNLVDSARPVSRHRTTTSKNASGNHSTSNAAIAEPHPSNPELPPFRPHCRHRNHAASKADFNCAAARDWGLI